ncbi:MULTISPECIES: helix-turn-helix domain-containing protein [Paraburkholderia]|jgi:transcriptional regulator with XRE-family HTH domain|uniref:Transcriptional regulator, XRE family with cupin sensor n=1 Tax=Paraburkholderia phenazinium TaxID=60549 RepID=A0A1N6FPH0_9BURK|nr:helix-turn-helix transcriptional regulator [Paraburkholderia phenazinium]SIN97166.1 transcriptional regulator, XRE family with cupin sensor [Paraburkholderia phenazinium]
MDETAFEPAPESGPDRSNAAQHLARNLVALRHARALTQEGLAKSSGVPRSTVANLESGEGNPSLAVLMKVASALGAPLDELLASPRAKVRKWSVDDISAQNRGNGLTIRPLVPEPVPDGILETMAFAPGAYMRGTPHLPGTREYFTCMEGRVAIFVAGERHGLETGDVLAFPGHVPHSYRNEDPQRDALGVSIVVLAKAGV